MKSALCCGLLIASGALAQDTAPAEGLRLGGYVEGYYQWNFHQPADGLTRLRGFDNRHDSFTLSNVSFSAAWEGERARGRLALQVGATPASYYLSEPAGAGSAGVNATGAPLWQYVQEAWGAYRVDVAGGVTVTAGLFTSPVGPETVPLRDNWCWSHSNLFFALPYYHVGVTAAVPAGKTWTVTAGVLNGWNAVVDGNAEKTLMVRAHADASAPLSASFLYMGGVERPRGAPEGRAWRHLLDAYASWRVSERLSLLVHADAGVEPHPLGTSGWAAAALSARCRFTGWLSLAGRAEAFREWRGRSGEGEAGALFWPVPWVASGTATLDFHPEPALSVRLEARHDQAGGAVYGTSTAGRLRLSQDTLTLGVVAGF